jgi:hypothetical protein
MWQEEKANSAFQPKCQISSAATLIGLDFDPLTQHFFSAKKPRSSYNRS